jgi:hypothetical protein
MFLIRRMSSVAAVAAEDAIDHGADNGNAIAGTSIIAVAITGAAVVDWAAAVVSTAAVIAAAGSDDNTTAMGVATRISTAGGASHRASAAATSGKGLSAAAAMPGGDLSAATTMTAWMAGSQRIRRHWHATQRDRGREGDESFFVKHVILLCFKQKFVCDCTDNARSRPRVARQRNTFACQAAMRFALIAHARFSGLCP